MLGNLGGLDLIQIDRLASVTSKWMRLELERRDEVDRVGFAVSELAQQKLAISLFSWLKNGSAT